MVGRKKQIGSGSDPIPETALLLSVFNRTEKSSTIFSPSNKINVSECSVRAVRIEEKERVTIFRNKKKF